MKNNESYAVGGQAVIEGVMMRGKKKYALAVRDLNTQELNLEIKELKNINIKLFKLPLIRGIVAFVQSLVLGMKIIMRSAELSGMDKIEEEKNPSRLSKWLENNLGDKLTEILIYISVVFSIFLSILLFMVLPVIIGNFVNKFLHFSSIGVSILEGLIRIVIFLTYILISSQLKDVKRIFMYHGAEHKTINCFENEDELTIENVKKYTRLHKRCGTSFLIIVMIISMIFFIFVKTNDIGLRIFSRIIFVPLIAGISYEIIKLAGKYDNFIINLISKPGLALQKITTKEPDDKMIEVAIHALKGILENDK